jgi:hypothetical protein
MLAPANTNKVSQTMTISCQVKAALNGDNICEFDVPQDVTLNTLVHQIGSLVRSPPKLLRLVIDDEVAPIDDVSIMKSCSLEPDCTQICIGLTHLPIRASCNTRSELCETLAELANMKKNDLYDHGTSKRLVQSYADEIVSILQQPLDCNDNYFFGVRTRSARIHIVACRALESLGAACSNLEDEASRALLTLFNDEEARHVICSLLDTLGTHNNFFTAMESTDFGRCHFGRHYCGPFNLTMLPLAFGLLFKSMGLASIVRIMHSYSKRVQGVGEWHKAVVLLSITRALLGVKNEDQQQETAEKEGSDIGEETSVLVEWFIPFLSDSAKVVRKCALTCLCRIVRSFELHAVVEPYFDEVLALLVGGRAAGPSWGMDRHHRETYYAEAGELLQILGSRLVPHTRRIIAAFFDCVCEDDARAELAAFQREVENKNHGAYMYFLKENKTSILTIFTYVLETLGFEGFSLLMQDYSETVGALVGPCQKAAMLWCFAKALPTFSKAHAAKCAAWIAPFLADPSWHLRMCAIHCLQRTLAGNMVLHADAIAACLHDQEPFVRQSAAAALGCLGRKGAMKYRWKLLTLEHDASRHVRYAALVALGGLLAKARPFSRIIAKHLDDEDPKCRMAALRALKLMGESALPHIDALKRWQQRWYEQVPADYNKPEPITTRALLFAHVPLKDLFRGHAPLGHNFAGSEATRNKMNNALKIALSTAQQEVQISMSACEHLAVAANTAQEIWKDDRERYVAKQARHRAVNAARHVQKRKWCAARMSARSSTVAVTNTLPNRRSPGRLSRERDRGRRRFSAKVSSVEDWAIPA